jgi:hypothetical protein
MIIIIIIIIYLLLPGEELQSFLSGTLINEGRELIH